MLNALNRPVTMPPTTLPLCPLEVVALSSTVGIRLSGEIDIATVPTLELALDVLGTCGDTTVDLTEVTFIDVLGCRALAYGAIRLSRAGYRLSLRGAGPRLRRPLDVLGWAALFVFERSAGRCPEEPVLGPALDHGGIRCRTHPGFVCP